MTTRFRNAAEEREFDDELEGVELNYGEDEEAACDCGCKGDYTDHSMRRGESGRW